MGNFNTAFRQISPQAKYCKVVGGDDWIYPRCLESLVAVGAASERGDHRRLQHLWRDDRAGWAAVSEGACAGRRGMCQLPDGKTVLLPAPRLPCCTGRISFRSRSPFFEEDHLHADLTTCLVSLKDRDFAFCHEVLSFNRKREGSLTATAQLYSRYVLEHLAVLERFGPVYLDKAEMRKQIRWKWAALYKGLGERVLQGHDRRFWRSQRLQTAAFGHKIIGRGSACMPVCAYSIRRSGSCDGRHSARDLSARSWSDSRLQRHADRCMVADFPLSAQRRAWNSVGSCFARSSVH